MSNGGDAAGKNYSLISIIDTIREEKVGDIRVESPGLEALVIDHIGGRLYINLPASSAIAVIDLKRRAVIATWNLAKGKKNMASVLDLPVIYYTSDAAIPMCAEVSWSSIRIPERNCSDSPFVGWVDSVFYDPVKSRICASTGVGEVFTYQRQANGDCRALEPVDTAVMAKAAFYSTELNRLFVSVPHLGGTPAKVLIFKPE